MSVELARRQGLKDWLDDCWSDCQRCRLAEDRTKIVLGDIGDYPLVFIGEAPGSDEDSSGRPFVGRAGKLLRRAAKYARLPIRRATVVNTLACRPPSNRNPEPEELEVCGKRVIGVLRALQPKLVVTLGKVSSEWILKRRVFITKERGTIYYSSRFAHGRGGVLLTLHPAYVLRNPDAERDLLADLKAARSYISEQ